MQQNAIQHAARRAKQQRRVGKDASCALCGYAEPEALRRAPISKLDRKARSIIERHHVVGRNHDQTLTIPLCRNCHAQATEQLRQKGVSMKQPNTTLERLISILKALAAFFEMLGDACFRWAEALVRFVAGLDAEYPAWREMPEAT